MVYVNDEHTALFRKRKLGRRKDDCLAKKMEESQDLGASWISATLKAGDLVRQVISWPCRFAIAAGLQLTRYRSSIADYHLGGYSVLGSLLAGISWHYCRVQMRKSLTTFRRGYTSIHVH